MAKMRVEPEDRPVEVANLNGVGYVVLNAIHIGVQDGEKDPGLRLFRLASEYDDDITVAFVRAASPYHAMKAFRKEPPVVPLLSR